MTLMEAEADHVGYNPHFLRRVRERREKQREDDRRRAAEAQRIARIAALNEIAERSRAEIIAIRAARDAELAALREVGLLRRTVAQCIVGRALATFGVSKEELVGPSRQVRIVMARQFISYWCRRRTNLSLPQIARLLGGRNHTTILHGERSWPVKRASQGRYLRPAR